MSFVVAIDGPAGSGKGTITKLVGEKVGLLNIDTGAMYRCVTLYMIENDIKPDDKDSINKMLENIDIRMEVKNNESRFFLNGRDVSKEIREKAVNERVSPYSQIPEIRKAMAVLERKSGENADIIMEGRDIGTSIFPDADVKIYLDATPEERARRRLKQNLEKGLVMSYEDVLKAIIQRDNNDKNRTVDPLRQADDATYLDTTELSIDEVVEKVIEIINKKKANS
ncbi:MAG: (d)CMP kinase [Clostridia bacterium]|nr:(d)CMP kinase [Clostridia bacterium]